MIAAVGKQSFVFLVLHLALLDLPFIDKVVFPLIGLGGRLRKF